VPADRRSAAAAAAAARLTAERSDRPTAATGPRLPPPHTSNSQHTHTAADAPPPPDCLRVRCLPSLLGEIRRHFLFSFQHALPVIVHPSVPVIVTVTSSMLDSYAPYECSLHLPDVLTTRTRSLVDQPKGRPLFPPRACAAVRPPCGPSGEWGTLLHERIGRVQRRCERQRAARCVVTVAPCCFVRRALRHRRISGHSMDR
jgi:hypothetical protein